MTELIKPGFFGKTVLTDDNRTLFDFKNEQMLFLNTTPDVLFIGDSITWMWDLPLYFGREKHIVNRGIGGDTSHYCSMRFDADCVQLKPKSAVLMIGTNDILTTEPDRWWQKPGADKNEVLTALVNNVDAMMEKSQKNGIAHYQCSVLPTDARTPYTKSFINPIVKEANEKLRALCDNRKVPFIDYHSALCENDGLSIPPHFTHDGIHPNGRCYQIMANVLKQYLKP